MTKLSPETKYRMLLAISQEISLSLDLPSVLQHLVEYIRTAVGYDAAGIFVLNRRVPPAAGSFEHLIAGMATVGFAAAGQEGDPMLRSGLEIVGHVIHTGETVVAPDVSLDPRYVSGRPETRSEISVPIVSNSQVIGALNLESNSLGAFSAEDAELLEFFATAAALAIEKAMLHRQALENERLRQQLDIAREVQGCLLPERPPIVPGYDIAGLCVSSLEIGGDYFDYIPFPDGRVGLVIADVSGKGVPAALIMATFRAALRTAMHREPDLLRAIGDVNHILKRSLASSRFVTLVCGVLDPSTGALTYVNCGHKSARAPPGGWHPHATRAQRPCAGDVQRNAARRPRGCSWACTMCSCCTRTGWWIPGIRRTMTSGCRGSKRSCARTPASAQTSSSRGSWRRRRRSPAEPPTTTTSP